MDGLFTKITSNNEADNHQMIVWLWDMGPKRPVQPTRPKPPAGKLGEPEYDLAKIEFEMALEEYALALREHKKAKEDYEKFATNIGGAVELQMWSCDADDALARDPKRYCISSRTRGHGNLPNKGLPEGVKPGHGQSELERREREGDADMLAARRRDPVFGEARA